MKYRINPILIEIAKNFKAAHTSEPDSVAAIALMIALNWRTDREPYLSSELRMTQAIAFDMPEKLARKLHPFLVNQGHLLGQLTNENGFYAAITYSDIVMLTNEVNADYTLKDDPIFLGGDWVWPKPNPNGYSWPLFTFVRYSTTYQAINKKILFMQG